MGAEDSRVRETASIMPPALGAQKVVLTEEAHIKVDPRALRGKEQLLSPQDERLQSLTVVSDSSVVKQVKNFVHFYP